MASWQDDPEFEGSPAAVSQTGAWMNDPLHETQVPANPNNVSVGPPKAPDGSLYKTYEPGWRQKLATVGQAVLEGGAPILDAVTYPFRSLAGEFGATDIAPSDLMNKSGITGNPNLTPDSTWGIPERRAVSTAKGIMGGLPFGPMGVVGGVMSENTSEAAKEAGANPTAAALLGMGVGGVTAAGGALTSKISNMNKPNGIIAAYQDAGVTPRLVGDVTGNPTLQQGQMALSKIPLASGMMKKAYNDTVGEVGNAVEGVANGYGPSLTQQELGQSLQNSANKYVERLRDTNNANYENLAKYYPSGNDGVALTNYQAALNKLRPSIPGMPATSKTLSSDLHTQLASDLEKDLPVIGSNSNTVDPSGGLGIGATTTSTPIKGNSVSYDAVKGLRSKIGEMLSGANAYADANTAGLKKLYAGLSQDLEASAVGRGTQAVSAMNKANAEAKAGHDLLDSTVHPIINAKSPEQAAQFALNGTGKGATTLNNIQTAMPDAFGNVQGYMMRNLGVPPSGEFSPSTLSTNYAKLSPEAQQLISTNPKVPSIMTVANAMKDTTKYGNPSGTAGTSHIMDLLMGGMLGHGSIPGIGTLATGGAMPLGTGAAMTSPWISKFALSPNNFNSTGLLGGAGMGIYNGSQYNYKDK